MNIVLDENIPFAQEYFGQLGSLKFLPGRKITPNDLIDVDALVVRSVTKVNENLLSKASRLKYVGTCTIGTDHVDQTILQNRSISFASAPGCNKVSVGEFVIASLISKDVEINNKTFAVIGAGNTGTSSGKLASALGAKVVYYDPFKEDSSLDLNFVSYEEALKCDIVTFHVPLTVDGQFPTLRMLDEPQINLLTDDQVFINASRGNVWNNSALLKKKRNGSKLKLFMDVWENEPVVLTDLIPYVEITTPHIAGYSAEGKLNGTSMIAKNLASCFNLSFKAPGELLPSLPQVASENESLKDLILKVYDPLRDDEIFRHQYKDAESFDLMRKNYPGRREWSALRVKCSDLNSNKAQLLKNLGFLVEV